MTHAELVARACRWLRRMNCTVVLAEPASAGGEIPDAIGWRSGGLWSHVVECKASRADFLSDVRKKHRGTESGPGAYRWYLAPPGVVGFDELPPGWGLLVASGRSVNAEVKATRREGESRWRAEALILFAELRKIEIVRGGGRLLPSKAAARIEGMMGVEGGRPPRTRKADRARETCEKLRANLDWLLGSAGETQS